MLIRLKELHEDDALYAAAGEVIDCDFETTLIEPSPVTPNNDNWKFVRATRLDNEMDYCFYACKFVEIDSEGNEGPYWPCPGCGGDMGVPDTLCNACAEEQFREANQTVTGRRYWG